VCRPSAMRSVVKPRCSIWKRKVWADRGAGVEPGAGDGREIEIVAYDVHLPLEEDAAHILIADEAIYRPLYCASRRTLYHAELLDGNQTVVYHPAAFRQQTRC
jgi:hypothetical protein